MIYDQELHVIEYYPADAEFDVMIVSIVDGEANNYDATIW